MKPPRIWRRVVRPKYLLIVKIYFDVTNARASRHMSGLVRVSRRLFAELKSLPGNEVRAVFWNSRKRCLTDAQNSRERVSDTGAHYVMPDLFSEDERPGFTQFLSNPSIFKLAIYHDAIPLRFPDLTWPRSVQRHPAYMKTLALFDRVMAVSDQSRLELQGYWRWLGIEEAPPVGRITLGSDFIPGVPHELVDPPKPQRQVLTVGIVEPRKNQMLLLDACEQLWEDGQQFNLVIAGRANPHFARPILERIRMLKRAGYPLVHRKSVTDSALWDLYRCSYFSVFPSRFEGCGLPVHESLWAGTPCICSDLPVLHECSKDGGCIEFCDNDTASLYDGMKRLLNDGVCHARLRGEVARRSLPTWQSAAGQLLMALSATSADRSTYAGSSRQQSGD
jgi:glycosyltransferase involved in cell wall biosynthesis